MAFYADVFGYDLTLETEMGPNPMAIIPNKDMHGDQSATFTRANRPPMVKGRRSTLPCRASWKMRWHAVTKAGGTVLPMPPISIPPGRFVYAQDPDGNSIGLFEPAA